MELQKSKEKFYQTWGSIGTNWGINRTMAQIHALLLVTETPVSTDDIMAELKISRGNANMNLRALMDWGLVQKEIVPGERMEYYVAEKDIWKVSKLIARERRKRELEPALKVLSELKADKEPDAASKQFRARIDEIHKFTSMTDSILERYTQSNDTWFFKLFRYIIK